MYRGRIVLTPRRTLPKKMAILADPITVLPVLTCGAEAPPLSSKQVEAVAPPQGGLRETRGSLKGTGLGRC